MVAKSDFGFILVLSCLLVYTCCQSSQGHFNKHVALFIFGDSLFDPGNNNYINTTTEFQANFWPYGESYFNPPSGRFSNGRLIPDFIAEFAGLPLIPAYLDPNNNGFQFGANFASAGSGALVETDAGLVVDLKTQLQHFTDLIKHYRKNLGDVKAEQLLRDAVYLFSCGSNDYKNIGENDSSLHHEQLVETVIENLTDVFRGIHEKGGRKFGICTVPSLGCAPIVRALQPGYSCNEEIDTVYNLHNQALSKKLEELAKKLEGFMYAMYDMWADFRKRVKNPSKYGFKVGDRACCGSGPFRGFFSCGGKRGIQEFELCENMTDYVFFDSAHPSEAANRQFAQQFWDGDSKATSFYNLKAFFQSEHVAFTSDFSIK